MEQTPHKDKFTEEGLRQLRNAILENILEDTATIVRAVKDFITEIGYSANDNDISDLITQIRKTSFEHFKKELERISKEH